MAACPQVSGWRESLLCVSDLEAWQQTYEAVGNWQPVYAGTVSDDMLACLGAQQAGPAQEVLLGQPGSEFGFVRLLCFDDARRHPQIRSNGRPWEWGGWFDLNSRVEDIGARFADLQSRGWGGVADPIEWGFGPVTVSEWLGYGPDGVVIALIERLQPPLDASAQPGRLGKHFNSTQIVEDIQTARQFYEELLGFEVVIEVNDELMMPSPQPNVLGLPNELAARQRWNIAMLKAPGGAGGSVEVISLPGLSGRDFSAQAAVPRRGIISHRFPTDDIHGLHQKFVAAGVEIVLAPRRVGLEPYGSIELMTVVGPCGARLDFFCEQDSADA